MATKTLQSHVFGQDGSAFWGKPYRLMFFLWRRSPSWFRSIFHRIAVAKAAKIAARDFLAKFAGREDLYNGEYYAYVDAEASRSAPTIVASVVNDLAPKRIIDVGCGTGALLAEFQAIGVSILGLEYSQAALQICKNRGLEVHPFNIENEQKQELGAFDAAICFEVAEHVSAACADPLVNLLSGLASRVVFTAATPGQGGGADHVNEQPHEYWIAKFEERGFRLIPDMTQAWRTQWQRSNVAGFYARNVMVFEKVTPGAGNFSEASQFENGSFGFDCSAGNGF
jgi:SAM-dependent methyltransferase